MADGTESRWAPWWWYVIAIGGSNAVASVFFLGDLEFPANSAVAILIAAIAALVVTALWRTQRGTARSADRETR